MMKDYFRRMSWVELFGIQIDDDGCYVPPKMTILAEISYSAEKKSTSQTQSLKKKHCFLESHQSFDQKLSPTFGKNIIDSSAKKPSSLKKEEKKKIFYSQNYMDIFSKPIDKTLN